MHLPLPHTHPGSLGCCCSKAVLLLLLLIFCFMYTPLFVFFMLVFVLVWYTLCPFLFCNHLDELDEKRADCFNFIDFCMSCPVALPHGAVGWSIVCNCGIS